MFTYSSKKQVLQIGDSMNPIKHLKLHHSYPRYIIYVILFAQWSYSEGCSLYRASALTRFKSRCNALETRSTPCSFLCVPVHLIPFHLYETLLSGLVLCVSAVSNTGLDHSCWLWFLKNIFQLQKLSQASLCWFLCHCCHLREVFNIAGWAFFNVDEFQQVGDVQNMYILHIFTRTQSGWHRIKVCMWGASIPLGILKKNMQGKKYLDFYCNSVWIKHWVIS